MVNTKIIASSQRSERHAQVEARNISLILGAVTSVGSNGGRRVGIHIRPGLSGAEALAARDWDLPEIIIGIPLQCSGTCLQQRAARSGHTTVGQQQQLWSRNIWSLLAWAPAKFDSSRATIGCVLSAAMCAPTHVRYLPATQNATIGSAHSATMSAPSHAQYLQATRNTK